MSARLHMFTVKNIVSVIVRSIFYLYPLNQTAYRRTASEGAFKIYFLLTNYGVINKVTGIR